MSEPGIIPPDEARAILADHVQLETSEQPHRCVGGHVWPCVIYRLAHTAAVLGEQREAVERLAEPYLGQPNGYQLYAVELDDGVHLAVLLDDLRDALGVTR